MSWDWNGNWINDGRTGMYDPRNDPRFMQPRQPAPPPGYSYFGQPAPQQGQPPTQIAPGGMTVTPEMVHVDIERVRGEQDIIDAIVPSDGRSRMFMSADERLIGTKCMGPNGPDIKFYYPQQYQPEPNLDPREVVFKRDLEPMVSRLVDDRYAQLLQSAPSYPQQTQPMEQDTAPRRTTKKEN